MIREEYLPENIDFNVLKDGTNVPESLGEFETPEDAGKFIGSNFTALNRGVTVSRHMDSFEKKNTREDYMDVLENLVPIYEKQLSQAEIALENAKATLKQAKEAYDFTIGRAKNLAAETKRGLKDIILDEKDTYRIPYKGRYYFFTYIEGQLKLALIREIPESEKTDLYNAMGGNEEFIDKNFGLMESEKKGKK
jgi:hypothetical protein